SGAGVTAGTTVTAFGTGNGATALTSSIRRRPSLLKPSRSGPISPRSKALARHQAFCWENFVNRFAGFVIGFLVLVAVLILASALNFEMVAWPFYQIRAGRLLAVPGRKNNVTQCERSLDRSRVENKGDDCPAGKARGD